ncbi:glycosyltransferase [Brevibacillus dissolubilis]|uniref:glycosyltransferase n=1 Tax=Brevibacillus dissolubilis TaxID=1844116 RepID=UPI0020FFFFD5|nr:glycosyltransferase [Brevibacillus dissolubilis]
MLQNGLQKFQRPLFLMLDIALNGVNYFFHIYTSWLLLPDDYGMLNTVLSLLSILFVLGLSVQTYTARVIAEEGGVHQLRSTLTVSAVAAVILIGLFIASQPMIVHLTRMSAMSQGLLLLIFVVHLLLCVNRGIFQGEKRFLLINLSLYTEVLVKMLVLLLWLKANPHVEQGLIAILVGMIVSLAVGIYQNRQHLPKLFQSETKGLGLGQVMKAIGLICVAQFFFYFFTSVDMLAVNYYLPQESGTYAVILRYSQLMLFFSLSVITLLVPMLSEKKSDPVSFKRSLKLALGGMFALCLVAVAGYRLVLPYTVEWMFGQAYSGGKPYLYLGAIVYSLFVLSLFLINFNMILNRSRHLIYLSAVSVLITVLLMVYHHSVPAVLYVQMVAYAVLLTGLLLDIKRYLGGFDMKKTGSKRTVLLFLSWRDIRSPQKGGAEVFTHEMLSRIDHEKYEVIHFAPQFEGLAGQEVIDGITYLRRGGILSVIWHAMQYYRKNQDRIDYVVDQCNTHRFLTRAWVPAKKRIFFIHQLTREIWYRNAGFPINSIGYWTETPLLQLSKHDPTITVSNSTKQDLVNIGFPSEKVTILPEGIEFTHWKPEQFLAKEAETVFMYVGRFTQYKGIDDTIEAFAQLKQTRSTACLWIVGKKDEAYMQKVLIPIMQRYQLSFGGPGEDVDVCFHGFVTSEQKLELMSRSHALVFPSLREGWGLTITEAAAVGTPSIVYHSAGLVDAVDQGRAGYLCRENTVAEIKRLMEQVMTDTEGYALMRQQAYEFSLNFHWDHTSASFEAFMRGLMGEASTTIDSTPETKEVSA